MDTSNEKPDIKSGVDLAKAIGCDLDEGVVVALFPAEVEQIYSQEAAYLDKKGAHCHAVVADCGPWGLRLLDVQSPNEEKIKWWKVKEVASIEQYDLIPVRWEGPIGEIPERYFDDDAILGVRFYQHGPWFWPKEKPVVRSEEAFAKEMVRVIEENERTADSVLADIEIEGGGA